MSNHAADPNAVPDRDYPIEVVRLTKKFGGRTILDDLSVTIEPGHTVALIGPSGGGKSTFLRCLNGLNTFDAGEVRVGPYRLGPDGGDVKPLRHYLGMIFQDFQLFPHLTALQNVTEAPVRVLGLPRREAAEKGQELLARVGLAEHAHKWPQQLSGGQKQRVAIARALAMKPRGLLCDEITSALDPELKKGILDILEDFRRDEGLTLIMVTHEIGFARQAADRVLVLADGRLIEDGPPSQVIDQPRTERAQKFLKDVLV